MGQLFVEIFSEKGKIERVKISQHSKSKLDRDDFSLKPLVLAWIEEWVKGGRPRDLPPLNFNQLTPFQRKVLLALRDIPFGQTCTYGELAKKIGQPRAARAVGQALNRNPFPLFLPCHRVVGADGGLTGFACGLPLKKLLLSHEAKTLRRHLFPLFSLSHRSVPSRNGKGASFENSLVCKFLSS